MRKVTTVAIVMALFVQPAFAAQIQGWWLTGDNADDYGLHLDRTQAHSGSTSALLAAASAEPRGFGALMQTANAEPYKGKRIKLSAYVKTSSVKKWAGLWLRIDGRSGPPGIAFDNMRDRPIVGDTDWKEYSVVLDVAEEATSIAYGALLNGPGKAWVDSVKIEIVGKEVPLTAKAEARPPRTPMNLDFEQ